MWNQGLEIKLQFHNMYWTKHGLFGTSTVAGTTQVYSRVVHSRPAVYTSVVYGSALCISVGSLDGA